MWLNAPTIAGGSAERMSTSPRERQTSVWMWWTAVALSTTCVLLPGPEHSLFSGVPLSSRATALLCALLIVTVATAMFRPHRQPRFLWSVAIAVLVVAKVLLAPALVPTGWRGVYATAVRLTTAYTPFHEQYFQNRGVAAQPFRIDRNVDFEGVTFGLSFVNEPPPRAVLGEPPAAKRDVAQPLTVHWTGNTFAERAHPLTMTVTASGRMTVSLDAHPLLDAQNPTNVVVKAELTAGTHRISVVYTKPPHVVPRARIGTSERITPFPADAGQLQRAARAATASNLLGIMSLLLLAAAWVDAYFPMSRLMLGGLWERPDKVSAVLLASVFILNAASISIPARHATIQVGIGDDPLAFEGYSRWIARNGVMMRDDSGFAEPYYFFPLYSYVLAGAHIVFGDDFSAIYLLNYLCMAADALLMWALLRRSLSGISVVLFLLIIVGPFVAANLRPYAATAFSDNLFIPVVLSMILASIRAFDTHRVKWVVLAGVLTSVGAATRTSLLTYIPCFCAALLLYREFASPVHRVKACAAYIAAFAVGIAPFTIRNWLVAKKFVLIVGSLVALPWFLFGAGEPAPPMATSINGRMPNFGESIVIFYRIFSSRPLHFTWHEIKKVLYTLGMFNFGPPGAETHIYFVIFPILFAGALYLKRIPKPVAYALVAFLASHITAVVMAAPWTYGYKTVLPFTLATMAGGAFLLRQPAGERRLVWRPVRPIPAKPSVSVVLTGLGAAARVEEVRAAFPADEILVSTSSRSALSEARGDWIVVLPPEYRNQDIARLVVFGSDADAVFGSRPRESGGTSRRLSWALAKCVGVLFRSRESLSDIRCGMYMIRSEVAETLSEPRARSEDELPLDMMMLALRSGARVIQVEVRYAGAEQADDVPSWFWHTLRLIVWRVRESSAAEQSAGPADAEATANG